MNDRTRRDGDWFDVVWPLAPFRPSGSGRSAARGGELSGKRIGFMWDYLFEGDVMFEAVRAAIEARFDGVEFVDHDAFGNLHGHDEHEVVARLPDVLRSTGVDSVVAAVGA